ARDAEVVDVHDGEVDATGLEQLGAVRRARGLLDVEINTLVVEVAACQCGVDPGMDGVRLEVEDQSRALRRARFSAAPSARREGRAQEGGRQQRGYPSHSGSTLSLRSG